MYGWMFLSFSIFTRQIWDKEVAQCQQHAQWWWGVASSHHLASAEPDAGRRSVRSSQLPRHHSHWQENTTPQNGESKAESNHKFTAKMAISGLLDLFSVWLFRMKISLQPNDRSWFATQSRIWSHRKVSCSIGFRPREDCEVALLISCWTNWTPRGMNRNRSSNCDDWPHLRTEHFVCQKGIPDLCSGQVLTEQLSCQTYSVDLVL